MTVADAIEKINKINELSLKLCGSKQIVLGEMEAGMAADLLEEYKAYIRAMNIEEK